MSGELLNEAYVDPVKLANEAKEIMVSERTLRVDAFNKWYQKFMQEVDKPRVKEKLDLLPFDYKALSIQTLIPEWFVEVPNAEIAKQQVIEANKKIDMINEIFNELNKEGVEKLKAFKELFER